MFELIPHLIDGLTMGLLFALIALGCTLIVSMMEVINLSHGALFALGAYIAMTTIGAGWFGATAFGQWWLTLPTGLRYSIGVVVGPLLPAGAGMVLELCLRPTYGKAPL